MTFDVIFKCFVYFCLFILFINDEYEAVKQKKEKKNKHNQKMAPAVQKHFYFGDNNSHHLF